MDTMAVGKQSFSLAARDQDYAINIETEKKDAEIYYKRAMTKITCCTQMKVLNTQI